MLFPTEAHQMPLMRGELAKDLVIEGRDGLSGVSPVTRFHCVRFAKRLARNGTSGFLPLGD
jgi:hypothetical protein